MNMQVDGHCPMGCGTTLFVGDGGHITCSFIDCPDPSAVDTILAEVETEHVVTLRAEDFTIRHPLRERINGELEACNLHLGCKSLHPSEVVPGTYRVTYVGIDQYSASLHDDGYVWERIAG